MVSRRTHRKHRFLYCCEGMFTAQLPSDRSIRCGGYVFSNSLPSNGHGADHMENTSCNPYSMVACAYFGRCLEVGLHVTIYTSRIHEEDCCLPVDTIGVQHATNIYIYKIHDECCSLPVDIAGVEHNMCRIRGEGFVCLLIR
jgi:hypothetical protein